MSRWLRDGPSDRALRLLRLALLVEAVVILGNAMVYSTMLLVMEVAR